MSDEEKKESSGYCNPPKHSQFKPGQSGNPKGRPKKQQKRFVELIEQELMQEITLTENGNQLRITKAEAILKRLVNDAIKGVGRNLSELLRLMPLLDDLQDERDEEKVYKQIMVARRLLDRQNSEESTRLHPQVDPEPPQ